MNKKKRYNNPNIIETAAALKYDAAQDNAPVVVASGQGDLAKKIKELARENKIPIFKDPVLAKTLASLGKDIEIPPELYETVAKILTFIYKIDQRNKR
ncbi:EscU/YscU/HrcU family type III secretion system export apparatus switch protein [Desulfolucanica intricata]|uniref:EscU/YscU/HrcU family type III secretion system export apparatus switch protein n=1 Tax=Desulfolucanica intricata TaxID=1285191 RepID=UPI0008325CC6|nr:EscU/YscU/HrcU family type III secretion system export apparatus switch protein [Desulfolucanica intricata]